MKEKPKVEKVSLCEEDDYLKCTLFQSMWHRCRLGTLRADDTLACETGLVYRFDAKRPRDTGCHRSQKEIVKKGTSVKKKNPLRTQCIEQTNNRQSVVTLSVTTSAVPVSTRWCVWSRVRKSPSWMIHCKQFSNYQCAPCWIVDPTTVGSNHKHCDIF